jgi:hypothetical protein
MVSVENNMGVLLALQGGASAHSLPNLNCSHLTLKKRAVKE